tara:strand:+ start:1202 stop:1909 length:708 start_codon:yes stop_codon:yes gene_type:complete
MSIYNPIANFYDFWSRSVQEDIPFYLELSLEIGGPVLELGIGTGRVAIPIAEAGIDVIGIDSSQAMLDCCMHRSKAAGVYEHIDLRLGDLADPPVTEKVPLTIVPFRTYLHLSSDTERRKALQAVFDLLHPGGYLAFDVFCPTEIDIQETHGRWMEREPEIWERAEWCLETSELKLSVRGPSGSTVMHLTWAEESVWRLLLEETGFEIRNQFGWFDRKPLTRGSEIIFVAYKPAA